MMNTLTSSILLIFFFFILTTAVQAQKYDYNWVLGTPWIDTITSVDNIFGGAILHFGENAAEPFTFTDIDIEMYVQNTSMSDAAGNLIYYSNGCELHHANHELILNGDSINSQMANEAWCYRADGNKLGMPQDGGMISLPHPIDSLRYYQIYVDLASTAVQPIYHVSQIFLNEIKAQSSTPSFSEIVRKKKVLKEGMYDTAGMSAVKQLKEGHWWIVIRNFNDNVYTIVDFYSPDSFDVKTQRIGIQGPIRSGDHGRFSPDGKSYVFSGTYDGIQVFDFDRGSGTLSNYRKVAIHDDPFLIFNSFSASSRFLYAWDVNKMYQFDMEAADVQASRVFIDSFDGFTNPFPTQFGAAQLGPDCKLYLYTTSGSMYYHVIDHPNHKGKSCGFRQHGLRLPAVNYRTIPNNPNYRLDTASPCDSSLTLTAVRVLPRIVSQYSIYPQPALDEMAIACDVSMDSCPTLIQLYNIAGQLVDEYTWRDGEQVKTINVSGLPHGLYVAHFFDGDNFYLGGQKLVVGW